jgi:hypothetical protein
MLNKKGEGVTDAGIILSILVFQSIIITGLGFISINTDSQNIDSGLGFSTNIINNITELGFFNLILFTPLIIVLTYLIVKLIRGGG